MKQIWPRKKIFRFIFVHILGIVTHCCLVMFMVGDDFEVFEGFSAFQLYLYFCIFIFAAFLCWVFSRLQFFIVLLPKRPLQMWCHIVRLLQCGAPASSESCIPRFVSKLTKMQEQEIHVCVKTFESFGWHGMPAFEGLGCSKTIH